jgi:hypothetical protein
MVTVVWSAPPAWAHEGNPDYRSEVEGIRPSVEGLEVEVLNFDDSLRLSNRSDATVVVLGYEDEPYLRISADGTVQVNRLSPSCYLNEDRYAQAEVPRAADPDAPPDWVEVDRSGQYAWHDHRIHYMAEGTPSQVTDEGERTKVFDYKVPATVDGKHAEITGTLYWVGRDDAVPIAPFVGLGLLAAAVGGAIWVARRRRGVDDGPAAERKEAW